MSLTFRGNRTRAQLSRRFNQLRRENRDISVGLLENAPRYSDGVDVVLVGSIHEFGEPRINMPARKWLSKSIQKDTDFYQSELINLLRQPGSVENLLLNRLGQVAVDRVRDHVDTNDINMEAESPRTQGKKGGSSPMIDTGHMISTALDFEVE